MSFWNFEGPLFGARLTPAALTFTDPFNLGSGLKHWQLNPPKRRDALPADGDYERDSGDTIFGFDTNCQVPMRNPD